MTTTTEAELLAEILRSPDELGPRTVLADLLTQRDDPRGELISIQCTGDPAFAAREAELLAKHGKQWIGPLGKLATEPVFRRGFVEQVTSTCINFIANGAALVKRFPLRALRITAVARVEDVERLLAMPALAQIRDLQLEASRALGKKHCQALAASPVLAGLTRLALPKCSLQDPGAKALAASPHLGGIRELCLRDCDLEPEGAEALAGAKLGAVRVLDVSGNRFSARGVHPFLHSKTLGSLVELDVSGCALGKQGGEIVAGGSVRASALERLRVASNALDDSNARRFAEASHFVKLRALDLSHNAITASGAGLLLAAKLPSLRELALTSTSFPADLTAQLARRFPSVGSP